MTQSVDVNAYLPPVFSIVLCTYQIVALDHLLSTRLREHVKQEGFSEEVFVLADGVARDRVLQLGYVAGFLAFISGLVAAIKNDASPWTLGTLWVVFAIGFVSALGVFLRKPGFLSQTRLHHKGWRARITYERFYLVILILLNAVVIVVTMMVHQPEKPSTRTTESLTKQTTQPRQ
jgi:uncharacterized membrane protein